MRRCVTVSLNSTLLVVEDDPSLAVTETIWLEREGFKVIHVLSGEEAIETVLSGTSNIDLILMDIELSGEIDGITASREILKHKEIPIIFLSSHTEKAIVEKTEEITSYGYVVKDSMENVLITAIKMAFKLYKAHIEINEKEKELQRSLQQLRESQQIAQIGTFEVDLKTDIWTCSEEFDRIAGITQNYEKTRDFWYTIVHPDFRNEVREYFDKIIDKKTSFNIEYKIVRPNTGLDCWVWESGVICIDENGNPEKLKGIIQNISYRKKIEENLLITESLYRVLLDDSSDPIFAIDSEGTYLYVNKAFAKGVNRDQHFIINRKIWDVFPPEEADRRFAAVRIVTSTGVSKVIEVKVSARGKDEYYMTTVQPLVSKYGKIPAVMCISKDITERKVAELNLAEKEKQYQNMFLNSPGALLLEDLEGNIIDLNPAFCKMFGYTRDELLGKNVRTFVPADEQNIVSENISKILNGDSYDHVVRNLKKDGSFCWVELSESRIKLSDGRDGILSLGNDITDRKLAEVQLEKYAHELESINSTKDKFFSIISHDLRGPFLAFLGLSKILAEEIDTLSQEKIKKVSKILNTSLHRQYELLTDLLDWSRIQSNKVILNIQNLNLCNEVEKVLEPLHLTAEQKEVSLSVEVDKDILIKADSNMLRLVLRNLISNGIKFSHKGNEVKISASNKGDGIQIIVTDSGVGIKEQNLTKLFQIDTRFSTDGTAKEKGTGLGLVLCQEIMEKHNGAINVESEIGKGTKFIINFPSKKE